MRMLKLINILSDHPLGDQKLHSLNAEYKYYLRIFHMPKTATVKTIPLIQCQGLEIYAHDQIKGHEL